MSIVLTVLALMIAYLLLVHISRMFSSMPGLAHGIARGPGKGGIRYDKHVTLDEVRALRPHVALLPINGRDFYRETEFNIVLWMPPEGERLGDIVLVDSTHFTTLFGGTRSLEQFWRNVARMPALRVVREREPAQARCHRNCT